MTDNRDDHPSLWAALFGAAQQLPVAHPGRAAPGAGPSERDPNIRNPFAEAFRSRIAANTRRGGSRRRRNDGTGC